MENCVAGRFRHHVPVNECCRLGVRWRNMRRDRARPEGPAPVAGEAMKRVAVLLIVRRGHLMRRVIVHDKAVPVGIVVRVEAMRYP